MNVITRKIVLLLSLIVFMCGLIMAAALEDGLVGFIAFIFCSLISLLIQYAASDID
jgi:hypothetical protein